MRFALKSRRGPHFPIASDAPKHLRKEIERRLDVVKDIKLHPVLVKENEDIDLDEEEPLHSHVYRMKVVDSLKFVEEDIVRVTKDSSRRKPPGQDVRFYLQRQARENGPLFGLDNKIINSFVESYIHARHEPPSFGKEEYKKHMEVLNIIRDHLKQKEVSERRTPSGVLSSTHQLQQSSSSINGSSVANTVIHQRNEQTRNRTPPLETSV